MKQLLITLVFCYIFLTATTNAVFAATFNVDTALELETALSTADSNGEDDTINIAAGTYSSDAFFYNTTDTDSLNIFGDDSSNTILTAPNGHGLSIFTAGPVMITDLDIRNSLSNGLIINGNATSDSGTFEVELYEVMVHDNGGNGLIMRNDWGSADISGNVHISGSRFYNNDDVGARIQGRNVEFDVHVEVNRFYNNDSSGLFIDVDGNNSNTRVERNHIYSNNAGSGAGLTVLNNCDCETVVVSNVIHNNQANGDVGGGVLINNTYATPTSTKLLVLAHNTIADNTTDDNGGGAYVNFAVDNADYRIFNNIFYANSANAGDDVYVAVTNYGSYFISNNLFTQFCMNAECNPSLFTTTYPGGTASNNVSSDPLFAGGSGAQAYKVFENSPAVGGGTMLGGAGPVNDYEGQSYTAPPNLGAFATFAEPQSSPSPSPMNNSSSDDTHQPSQAQAPTCSDQKPIGTPDLFQIDRSASSAKLYFTPVNNGVKKYHVIYGYNSGDARFGLTGTAVVQETNNGVQIIAINHLDPKVNYWFQVVPVNGCAVGDWSNWLEAKRNHSSSYRLF